MRDLLDAAWGDFPTDDVGYDWARYTGAARPTAEWVAAIIRHSLLTFIQESYSSRSSEGYDVGVADCQYAEARAREVYPSYQGSIVVAVSDGNSADRWDASGYGAGWSAAATLAFLPYGTPAICASFCAGAGSNPLNLMGDMVPETWGTTSPPMRRLITQTVGASPIANTDLDIVHADYTGGAKPAPTPLEDDDVKPFLFSTNPGTDPAFQVFFSDLFGCRVKDPIAPDELDTLGVEMFAKMYDVDVTTGTAHPCSPDFLNGLPLLADLREQFEADVASKVAAGKGTFTLAQIAKAVNDDAAARLAS